ncbi:DUF4870 domain-containing protein [Lacibacter luteus]|uniref:DUF4870 domain-containing protein n=1 Tax=Lacibacter luteus TaxID=2508719 RepID=A0A4Q1CK02_9BACT|nr:DUF4870 domain-containing protein [Lacibacter luteus]RXK60708.1 DUF4870 domain-containing protein [Lacibacter luteus]
MDSKTISWVSYLTIIGWIVAYVNYTNSNPKQQLATFHLRQSFGLVASSLALYLLFWTLVFAVPMLSFLITILWLVLVVLWVLGFIAALNGEEKPLPVAGAYFQQWFTFIK